MKQTIELLFTLVLAFNTNIFPQTVWNSQSSGTANQLFSVHFVDSNTGWVVGRDGAILKTTDGGTNWLTQTSGTTVWLFSVYFADSNTGWVVGSSGTILKTTNGGTNWNTQSGTLEDLSSVYFIDSSTGWVVGSSGTILKTTNGGTNWNTQSSGGTTNWLRSVHFVNNNTGWLVGTTGFILNTTNGGTNWNTQTSGTTQALSSVYFIDSNRGWAAGDFATIVNTTNGGTTWNSQSSGTTTLKSVHFVDSSTGWAVGNEGTILNTTNGGVSWTTQASGTSQDLYSTHFININTGWAVGSWGTILKATNAPLPVELTSFSALVQNKSVNLTWQTATEVNNYGFKIERSVILSAAKKLNADGGTSATLSASWETLGFVQGHGNSNSPKDYSFEDKNPPVGKVQYRLKQIDFDGRFEYSPIVEVNVETPSQLMLAQNYPNPFNPTTVINYQIPAASHVTLKMYDVLGKEVATLVDEFQPAGTYNSKLNTQNLELSSGVYFYKLQTDNGFSETKKLMIMK